MEVRGLVRFVLLNCWDSRLAQKSSFWLLWRRPGGFRSLRDTPLRTARIRLAETTGLPERQASADGANALGVKSESHDPVNYEPPAHVPSLPYPENPSFCDPKFAKFGNTVANALSGIPNHELSVAPY